MDPKEKLTLEAIQGMLQQEDIRSENRKVHERLERIEQGTLSHTRDTKWSLYDDLEEEAQDGDSTYSNKAKAKDGYLVIWMWPSLKIVVAFALVIAWDRKSVV